jgi:transketolase
MPFWELFEAQDDDYRSNVLRPDSVRVAVEAAVGFGWDRYLGDSGGFIGMSGFGASGPASADQLYKHFRITPGAIVAEAKALSRIRDTG